MGDVKFRLLITGAGAPGFAGIYHCLCEDPELEIFCCDAREDASGRAICANFFSLPKANDPAFAEILLKQCQQHQIGFVLPIVTAELQALAPLQGMFQNENIRIVMNPEEPLLKANDKCRLYTELQKLGIATPEFRIVNSADDLETLAHELGYPDKDIIVKPCRSNGSRGFRVLSEKSDQFKAFFESKPGALSMRISELKKILAGHSIPPLMLSEYLPGPEYSIDMICHHGQTLLCVPRLRSRINNGISVEGSIEPNQEIIDYCRKIAKALNLHAFNGIQVKQSSKGEYSILEINPRLQGTTSAVRLAGVNIPQLGIDFFIKEKPFYSEWKNDIHWNTAFFRVYQDWEKN